MEEVTKWVAEQIKRYSKEDIEITDFCRRKMTERGIDEEVLISTLFNKTCFFAEAQNKSFRGEREKGTN